MGNLTGFDARADRLMNVSMAKGAPIPAGLRESGLIRTEKHGLEHISRLRRAEIDKKFPGLLRLVLKLSTEE